MHWHDQEGEGERLDTLGRARHRWMHVVQVGVARVMASPCHGGQVRKERVAEVQRGCRGCRDTADEQW